MAPTNEQRIATGGESHGWGTGQVDTIARDWWLRSVGTNSDDGRVRRVNPFGTFNVSVANDTDRGVRPAIWVRR